MGVETQNYIDTSPKVSSQPEAKELSTSNPDRKLEEASATVDATLAAAQETAQVKESFRSKYKWWLIGASAVGVGALLLKPWKRFSDDEEQEEEQEENNDNKKENRKNIKNEQQTVKRNEKKIRKVMRKKEMRKVRKRKKKESLVYETK